MADVELLFGVLGGGSISGASGNLIQTQLNSIVGNINKKPIKIKAQLDPASLASIKTQIRTLSGNAMGSVSSNGFKISGDIASLKNISSHAVRASSSIAKLKQITNQLERSYARLNSQPVANKQNAQVQSLIAKYSRLLALLRDANGAPVNSTKMKQAQAEVNAYCADIERLIGVERKAGAASKSVNDDRIASLKQVATAQDRINKLLTTNPMLARSPMGTQLKTMLSELTSGAPVAIKRLREIEAEIARIKAEAAVAGKLGKTLGGTVLGMFEKFGGWSLVTRSMLYIRQAFHGMIKDVRSLDSAMTELRKVTDETDSTYSKFFDKSIDRAKSLGATVTDTISATADFARLGYNVEEAQVVADAALVYKNVGDGIDSIDTASESIISTMQGFGVAASDAMLVVDKFNEVGNNFAISSAGIGDALVRSAAALSAANNSLDESIALVTATNKVVQDPEKVGTTLKTVSMYLRAAKTEAEEAGIETDGMADSMSKLRGEILALTGNQVDIQLDEDTFKSTYQIMKEIAGVWDQISDVSQANILEKLGGKRNSNVVAALIQNFDEAEKILETSANASGSALRENEKYLDSIEGKIQKLNVSAETFSSTMLESDTFKGVIDGATSFLDILTRIVDMFGSLPTTIAAITGIASAVNMIKSPDGNTGFFNLFKDDKGVYRLSLFRKDLGEISNTFKQINKSGSKLTDAKYGMGALFASFTSPSNYISAYNDTVDSVKNTSKALADAQAKGLSGKELDDYSNAAKRAADSQDTLVSSMRKSNSSLHAYLTSLNGAKASMAGYVNYCKQAGIAVNLLGIKAKAAAVGMQALQMAGSMLMTMGVAWVITTVIQKISELIHKQEELRQETTDAAASYKTSAASISDYKAEIDSLKTSIESGTLSQDQLYDAKQRLNSIQDELLSSYGAEVSQLNLVAMSADEAAAAMERLAKAEAEKFLRENAEGIEDARVVMERETTRGVSFSRKNLNDYQYAKLRDIANANGITLKSNTSDQSMLTFTADTKDAYDILQKFREDAEAQGINLGDIEIGDGKSLNDAVVGIQDKVLDITSEYDETYRQYINSSITASDEYSSALQGLTDAQTSYEEAVSKSYTSEYDRAEAVANSIARIEEAKAVLSTIQFDETKTGIKDYFDSIVGDLNSMYSAEKLKLNLGFADKASIKEYTGLVKEYQNAIAETKEVTGKDFLGVEKFGNIDTGIRERLEWTTENVELYRKAIESWGASADEYLGSYSTVDGRSDKFGDYEIAFTPMLNTKDGVEYLDKDSVYGYIKKIISEAEKDGSVSQAEILRLDTKGLEVDGKKISNIIAAVGDDAIKVGELMHFTGANGAINDAFNRLGGEYGDKNAISSMIDALGKLDQDSDGVTKISEILETMAKVDSGAADVLKEDADAIELIKTMAESANVPVETFLNTLSEVGLTRGYIGDALSALTSGLGSVESGFSSATAAIQAYNKAMEAGEKNDNHKAYTEAFDTFQAQVTKGTTESNAFWNSAELLLGEDKLRDLEYNSQAVIASINSVKQAWANDDNGEGFFNYVYGLQQQGKLLDEHNRQLIDIQKNGSEWKFDFDTENLDQILPILNMTEDGFYACLEAMNMWRVSSGADATEIAERIDQLGLSVENANEKFIASDSIEESLEPLYGKQGAYRAVQELEELGYTLISVQDILADSEGGAQEFADALSKMGVATADGDSLVVNLDDMTKSLTEMGMTSSEIASLLSVLGEIEGLSLVDAEGQVLSLDTAIRQITRGDTTRSLGDLAAAATTSAEALKQFEGNEDLDIKINVSDIEDVDDKISTLDDTIAKMNKIKAKPKVDPSEVEHANDVIAYCVVQKQMLSQPEVMAVETDQVEGELGNVISLLQDFQNLQNTKELYLALGMNEAVDGEGGIQAQIDKKISEIQATDPSIQAGLKIDSTSEESLQASIDSLTAGMMISVGVNPTAIAGAEEGQTCTVTYTPNTDALPESFDTIDRTVAYKPNLKALPSSLSKITRIVEYVPTGDTEVNGTAHAAGTAKAWGDWGTAPGGRTLVGELGQEIVVNPRTGRWYTVGDFGAEFVNIEPGSIVFNHKQTQSLLENGFVTGRGRALASGTAAFVNSGSGTPPSLSGTTSTSSSSKKKSTYKANLEVEADTSSLEESMKDALDKIKEEVERIIGDYEHKIFLTEKNNGNLEDIVAMYKKMQDTVNDYADQYRAKGLDENSDYITDLQKQWWEYEDAIVEAITSAYEEVRAERENAMTLTENWLEDAVTLGDTDEIRERTNEIIAYKNQIKGLIEEQIEMYRAQGLKDTSDEVSELLDMWHDIDVEIREVQQDILDSLHDMVDGIQDVYDTLHDAADEYAETGYISLDTFQKVMDLGAQYVSYLIDENGQLVINEKSIKSVIAARTEELAVQTALNYVDQIRLALEKDNVDQLNKLLYATELTTESTWGLVYANLALLDLTSDQFDSALSNINAIRALSVNTINGIMATAEGGKNAIVSLSDMHSGMKDIIEYVMDMLADRLEEQIDALEKQKEDYADLIDLKKESLEATKEEADYQKSLTQKIKDAAKLQERINLLKLDDSREAQAERVKLEEELAEKQGEIADEQAEKLLESQTSNLDKMKDANEKQKDAEIKNLEETASSYEKRWQQAIQYIEANWGTLLGQLKAWNYEMGNSLESEIVDAWNAATAALDRYKGSFSEVFDMVDTAKKNGDGDSRLNLVVGETIKDNGSVEQVKGEAVKGILGKMYSNSMAWHSADEATRKQLADENLALGASLKTRFGIDTYRNSKGEWIVDGELLYDKYKEYAQMFHTGGIVGGGTIKSNEQLALLKNDEWVLSEKMVKNLSAQMDRIQMLRDGVSSITSSLSSLFRLDSFKFNSGDNIHNVTTNNSSAPVTITVGDTVISGANEDTVRQHTKVSEDMVNQIARIIGVRR